MINFQYSVTSIESAPLDKDLILIDEANNNLYLHGKKYNLPSAVVKDLYSYTNMATDVPSVQSLMTKKIYVSDSSVWLGNNFYKYDIFVFSIGDTSEYRNDLSDTHTRFQLTLTLPPVNENVNWTEKKIICACSSIWRNSQKWGNNASIYLFFGQGNLRDKSTYTIYDMTSEYNVNINRNVEYLLNARDGGGIVTIDLLHLNNTDIYDEKFAYFQNGGPGSYGNSVLLNVNKSKYITV